ncbi:hypothetical protein Aduo_002567 [Ancylostoma duodenale]
MPAGYAIGIPRRWTMLYRGAGRSTLPSPNAIGVRGYGDRSPGKPSYDQTVGYAGQEYGREQQRDMRPVFTLTDSQAGTELFSAEKPHFDPVKMEEEESYSRKEFMEDEGEEESYSEEESMEDEDEDESYSRREFMEDEEEEESYPRREFIFKKSPPKKRRQEITYTLSDCISNGFMDMKRAAELIFYQMGRGVFSQASYDDFVNSEDAIKAVPRFSGLNDLTDPRVLWLNTLANRLMAEITRAHVLRTSSKLIERKTPPPNSTLHLSLSNCSKKWKLQASSPFVELNIVRVAERWMPRKNDTVFQQLTSLFRYILLRITEPPQRIKEFAIRVNRGRDSKLKDLPKEVEATLTGFGEDIIGCGEDESNSDAVLNGPRAFKRSKSLAVAPSERAECQSNVWKSLQRALRDVRSYEFDEAKGKWLPNNRKSKRAPLEKSGGTATNEATDTEDQPSSKSASNK